jgi:hypothetical protein
MIHCEHIVGARHMSLYTDRSDLVHIFDPFGQYPGIARQRASNNVVGSQAHRGNFWRH